MNLIPLIAPYVRVHLRSKIAPDADLVADLQVCEVDRLSIAHAVEEHFGFIMPDAEFLAWQTVADIERSIEYSRRIAA